VRAVGVGVLYNRALTKLLLARALPVDYVEVIPERCWTDRGRGVRPRFVEHPRDLATLEALAQMYPLVAHGVGLSIASATQFDIEHIQQLGAWRRRFGVRWVSEHLAAVRVTANGVVDHHAGIALPLPWDLELLRLLVDRVRRAVDILGCPLLLENGTVLTPVPDTDLTEVEFLNRLTAESPCRLLLDLHNLFVNSVNLGLDAYAFVRDLDLTAVEEIHIAGGNELDGIYLDSHAGACPPEVWRLLETVVPQASNLRGVTFEFHESYFAELGDDGLRRELVWAAQVCHPHCRETDATQGEINVATGVPARGR
jgi:uncharacterized protein (UPF0276 family)